MKDIIRSVGGTTAINLKSISDTLKTKIGKPNFSVFVNIALYDYFGLMGGTQNIEVEFEITPMQNRVYDLETKMYINDWYGADAGDINGSGGFLKRNARGLQAFFYLQHCYGCKPFPTQIIYKSKDKIKLDN